MNQFSDNAINPPMARRCIANALNLFPLTSVSLIVYPDRLWLSADAGHRPFPVPSGLERRLTLAVPSQRSGSTHRRHVTPHFRWAFSVHGVKLTGT